MSKENKEKIWDKALTNVDEELDHKTSLTEHEEAIIRGAVFAVVHNIFRREKDPLKRRVLISQIAERSLFEASQLSTLKAYNVRKYHLIRKKLSEK